MPTLSFASGQEVFISGSVRRSAAWMCWWGPVASQHRVPISHPSLTLSCLDASLPSPPPGTCALPSSSESLPGLLNEQVAVLSITSAATL